MAHRAVSSLALGALLLISSLSFAAPTPPPTRWVLVYAARPDPHPAYTVPQFTRLLTHVDSTGRSEYWLCTGMIFLHLYAPSGRVFTTWIGGTRANGDDWREYLDSLFVPGGVFSRLDSAVALATAALGPPPAAIRVSIMIPYPEPKSEVIEFAGARYGLKTPAGRISAATAYVAEVAKRFPAAGFAHLEFDGFYWLLEAALKRDREVIAGVSSAVRARGLRFVWIPFYGADGWDRWRELGFDEAWLQPNYFFDRDVPASRLDAAAARAEQNEMGLEIEFDPRMYTNREYRDRLEPYLAALELHPTLRARSIVVYEGGGALLYLSTSKTLHDRMYYEWLGEVLR